MKKQDLKARGDRLDLRREMLRRYHTGSAPSVYLAGTDAGLWEALGEEFQLAAVFAPDVLPAGKREKARAELGAADHDIFDLGYGPPWALWFEVLAKATKDSVTVLLEVSSAGKLDGAALGALGLASEVVPKGMLKALAAWAPGRLLGRTVAHGWEISEARQIEAKSARGIAVRLRRRDDSAALIGRLETDAT